MIGIGTVWDRTTEVIGGRLGILARIALLLIFLPAAAQGALVFLGDASDPTLNAIRSLVQFAASVMTMWGALALTAVASDPGTTRGEALSIGLRRLPVALAVTLVLLVALFAFSIPAAGLIAAGGYDVQRATAGMAQTSLNMGMMTAAALYLLTLLIVILWLGARLLPLLAVIVNERRGLRAIARSFGLTRGATLRLVGVMILYGIVFLVAFAAATSVTGLVSRLALGAEGRLLAAFLSGVAGAAVSAGFGVVQSVFSAQFYVAARDAGART